MDEFRFMYSIFTPAQADRLRRDKTAAPFMIKGPVGELKDEKISIKIPEDFYLIKESHLFVKYTAACCLELNLYGKFYENGYRILKSGVERWKSYFEEYTAMAKNFQTKFCPFDPSRRPAENSFFCKQEMDNLQIEFDLILPAFENEDGTWNYEVSYIRSFMLAASLGEDRIRLSEYPQVLAYIISFDQNFFKHQIPVNESFSSITAIIPTQTVNQTVLQQYLQSVNLDYNEYKWMNTRTRLFPINTLIIPSDIKQELYDQRYKGTRERKIENQLGLTGIRDEDEMESMRPQMESMRPQMESMRPQMESMRPQMESMRPQMESMRPQMDDNKTKLHNIHENIMKSIRGRFPPGKNMYERDFTPIELEHLRKEGIYFTKDKPNPTDFLYEDEIDNHEEVMNIIRMRYPPNEVMYKRDFNKNELKHLEEEDIFLSEKGPNSTNLLYLEE
jgi:hypothetical protein